MFSALVSEAIRMLEDHRKVFHSKEKKDCRVCRSLRRAIIGGIGL